jgi:hypothetical protein
VSIPFDVVMLIPARLRGEAAIPCVRNSLMASTIVVTAGVNILPPNDEHLATLCDHIINSLGDSLTLNIAAQCCRTLVTASPKSATDQELIRYLLPKLIRFVVEETAPFSPIASILTTQFTNILFGQQQEIAVSLFVPMLLERARRSHNVPSASKETAVRLLELAQISREAFRSVVANLDVQHRSFMEELLRSNVAGGSEEQAAMKGHAQPSIELKMNFG